MKLNTGSTSIVGVFNMKPERAAELIELSDTLMKRVAVARDLSLAAALEQLSDATLNNREQCFAMVLAGIAHGGILKAAMDAAAIEQVIERQGELDKKVIHLPGSIQRK